MDSIEVTAKKVDDAIKEGLKQLSATLDDVDVKVLDTGGFFRKAKIVVSLTEEVRSIRQRERAALAAEEKLEAQKAAQSRRASDKIETAAGDKQQREGFREGGQPQFRQTPPRKEFAAQRKETERGFEKGGDIKNRPQSDKPRPHKEEKETAGVVTEKKEQQPVKKAAADEPSLIPQEKIDALVSWLTSVLEKIGVPSGMEYQAHGRDLDVTLLTDDGAIIGYRGETLDSLEYLAGLVVNKDNEKYVRVSLDCNSYRNKREEALVKLAEKMAAKCVKQGHKVSLEPMNSVSRKVIHAALADNDKITTKSEGKEPNRRVVIYCKRD